MADCEIRWYVLAAVAVLLCLAQLALETTGVWFSYPARPDWLWGLALYAALRVPAAPAVAAFAVCGVARDLFLGPRLGSAAIVFLLIGRLLLSWRHPGGRQSLLTSLLLVVVSGFFVAVLRHSLDFGVHAYRLLDSIFFLSAGDCLLTGAGYLPLMLLLGTEPFRPYRARI